MNSLHTLPSVKGVVRDRGTEDEEDRKRERERGSESERERKRSMATIQAHIILSSLVHGFLYSVHSLTQFVRPE